VEKDFILAKLEQNNWNISQTAREIDAPPPLYVFEQVARMAAEEREDRFPSSD